MAACTARGSRTRLIGTETIPERMLTAARLQANDPLDPAAATVWFAAASCGETPRQALLAAGRDSGTCTRAEAIGSRHGADIPPADLFVDLGKPELYAMLAPPLLYGKLQCYWRQRFGYDFSQPE